MFIAIDFDGTIVQHKYPAIGEEIPFAIETLKIDSKRVTPPPYSLDSERGRVVRRGCQLLQR